jgi:hypothetical protein
VSICQKFSGGKPPDPHSKEKGRERREGKGKTGKRGEEERRVHPQIKFYDYSTACNQNFPD